VKTLNKKIIQALPNIITIFRFFLIFPFVLLDYSFHHTAHWATIVVLFFVFFGDCVDGYLARKFNAMSDLGKIIDPVFDKLTFILLSYYFYLHYQLPSWVLGMFLLREIIVLGGAYFYRKNQKELPVSNFWGKLSTTFWGLTFGAFFIQWPFFYKDLVYFGLILILFSSASYLWKYFHQSVTWQALLWVLSFIGTVFFEIYLFLYYSGNPIGIASFIFLLFIVMTLFFKQNDIINGWLKLINERDYAFYSHASRLLKHDFFKLNFYKLFVSYLDNKLFPLRSIWVFSMGQRDSKIFFELEACNKEIDCKKLFRIHQNPDNIIFKKYSQMKEIELIASVHPSEEQQFIHFFNLSKIIIYPIMKNKTIVGLLVLDNECVMSDNQKQIVEFIIFVFSILMDYQGIIVEQEEMNKGKNDLEERAAITEMTAGVLHNIGNAVTSTIVKTQLSKNLIESVNIEGLEKTLILLRKNRDSIQDLFDKKGDSLLKYFDLVLNELTKKRTTAITHLDFIFSKLQHIGEIISIQQSYSNLKVFKEYVNINQIIKENFSLYEDSLEKREIITEYYFREDIPMILIESAGLMQVFSNLVKNSIEAIDTYPEGDKRIIVRTDIVDIQGKKFIKVIFSDSGIGISEDHLNKISNYGFTTKKSGHGFGLHYSFNFIKKAGGMIKIRSEGLNKGVTFLLYLPLNTKKES